MTKIEKHETEESKMTRLQHYQTKILEILAEKRKKDLKGKR